MKKIIILALLILICNNAVGQCNDVKYDDNIFPALCVENIIKMKNMSHKQWMSNMYNYNLPDVYKVQNMIGVLYCFENKDYGIKISKSLNGGSMDIEIKNWMLINKLRKKINPYVINEGGNDYLNSKYIEIKHYGKIYSGFLHEYPTKIVIML